MTARMTSSSLFTMCGNIYSDAHPDEPSDIKRPSDDFVLCRDKNNKPTAIYGRNVWNFNPYRLSTRRIMVIYFDNIFDEKNEVTDALVAELKWLIYILIYFAGFGKIGRLNASTIISYYLELTKAARYCYGLKSNKLIGSLSLSELFSNPVYLSSFVYTHRGSTAFNKKIPALLKHFIRIGEEIIGYRVCSKENLDFGLVDSKQHPVIPTSIYLRLINHWSDLLESVADKRHGIRDLISRFKDDSYGLAKDRQKALGVGGVQFHRPDMLEAINDHGLNNVFVGPFIVTNKNEFGRALSCIQYVCKNVIHLYTGMRDQEVSRLKIDCLAHEEISEFVMGSEGEPVDDGRIVTIVSTTTKFTGYRKDASWLAPDVVVRAIELARAIAEGFASLLEYEHDLADIPLFMSNAVLRGAKNEEVTVNTFSSGALSYVHPLIEITENDVAELKASDPDRDFSTEIGFSIGSNWPLASHQYRRSLSFYGSSSGFISLPGLKKQFKHATIQMAQYYRRGFQNLKAIFGIYNEKTGEFDVPANHILFEFQTGITIDTAHMILSDVLGSEGRLFGGVGTYIEKQRDSVVSGSLNIMELRTDTEKRVRNGELAYQQTLLGGCTKTSSCDEYVLGDFTACLGCEKSIIDEGKLSNQIEICEIELSGYEAGSGEHQVIKFELDKMKDFQARKIKKARNG